MKSFLRTQGTKIVDGRKPVYLRGVNFGGWLMMEAYFTHAPNLPEQKFKKYFKKTLGQRALDDFEESYRRSYIQEKDFEQVARWGFNCVRLPFNYRLIEGKPYQYNLPGLQFLDKAIRWAQKYKVWVILDMHAAPGCQNHDWHSDSYGKAELWTNLTYQKRMLALWEFLADRYKDKEYVAGYDILNEAVTTNTRSLNKLYKNVIRTIRSVDKNHILFIEGNHWAQDLKCLDRFDDDNYALSVHSYEPIDFTFNFVPHLRYPLRSSKGVWNKAMTKRILSKHQAIAKKHGVPVFVGEFGVNYRDNLYNESGWLDDTLSCFKGLGFHWTYWTYKAVKNNAFPDGILSYYDNPPWVNRSGPLMGWETYHLHWRKQKIQMRNSWRTKFFKENSGVLKVLRKYV